MVTESRSLSVTYQIDRTGRKNPSTTNLVRTPEFRMRVREGRIAAGLSSTFIDDPKRSFDLAVEKGALNKLTDTERDVLVLRYGSGMSQVEAAAALGKKPKAVSKIERYALMRLEGNRHVREAEEALVNGEMLASQIPFLTDLERKVLTLHYGQKFTLTNISKVLERDIRRIHEIRNAAIHKVAFMCLSQHSTV